MSAAGDFAVRWRVRLGYPVALLYLFFARPIEASIFIGAVIAIIGLWLRAAAAGHLRKHQQLSVAGPYAYTRNPLYFGSMLIAAGFLVAGRFWVDGAWIAVTVVAAYFGYFYRTVMQREAQELRIRYGTVYDGYASRVPLFLPKLSREDVGSGQFSWHQYKENREYQAALGVLGGMGILWLIMLLRAR